MANKVSLQEAQVHGVSTRSVDDLVKAMGAGGMPKSQVSRLCAEVDERVSAFLSRPLEGAWRAPSGSNRWRHDAAPVAGPTFLKVREGGRIIGKAVIIAVAVREDGKREVPGAATGPSEAETCLGPSSCAHWPIAAFGAPSWRSPTTTTGCAPLPAGCSTPAIRGVAFPG